jgi:hypothetical protein
MRRGAIGSQLRLRTILSRNDLSTSATSSECGPGDLRRGFHRQPRKTAKRLNSARSSSFNLRGGRTPPHAAVPCGYVAQAGREHVRFAPICRSISASGGVRPRQPVRSPAASRNLLTDMHRSDRSLRQARTLA